jgi:hypothetical protein
MGLRSVPSRALKTWPVLVVSALAPEFSGTPRQVPTRDHISAPRVARDTRCSVAVDDPQRHDGQAGRRPAATA